MSWTYCDITTAAGYGLRPLTGRSQWPYVDSPSYSSGVQFQTLHQIRVGSIGLRLLYINNSASSINFKASIRKGFSGNIEMITANGSTNLILDAYSLMITDLISFTANAGDWLYVRTFVPLSSSQIFKSGYISSTYNPEGINVSPATSGTIFVDGGFSTTTSRLLETGMTFESDLSSTLSTDNTQIFGPYSVLGLPISPTRLTTALGDSKTASVSPDKNDGAGRSWITRLMSQTSLNKTTLIYQNLSVSGDTIGGFLDVSSSSTLRRQLIGFDGDFINHYGANSLGNGADPTTETNAELANIQTLKSLLPRGSRLYNCTADPYTIKTSGSWATITEGQQAAGGNNSNSINCVNNFNSTLRASPLTYGSGLVDLASVVETSLGSGLWLPDMTGDGIHQNDNGHSAQASLLASVWLYLYQKALAFNLSRISNVNMIHF